MKKKPVIMIIMIATFCIGIAGALLSCNSNDSAKTDSILKQARFYIDKNSTSNKYSYNKAIELCSQILETNQKNASVFCIRANAYVHIGDYDKAIRDCRRAFNININIKGGEYNPFFITGYAFMQKGDMSHAAANFSRVIEEEPKYPMSYNYRGYCFYHSNIFLGKQRASKAMEDYKKAVHLDPGNKYAYANIGWIYLDNHDKRAKSYFGKAISLDAKYTMAYLGLANCYYLATDYNKTIIYCSKAILLNTKSASAYDLRGEAYLALNNHDAAIDDLNKAISINSSSDNFYEDRSNIFLLKADYQHALKDINNAIIKNPFYSDYYVERANIYFKLGKKLEGFEDFNKALQLDSGNASAYYQRSKIFQALGQRDMAQADMNFAQALNPSLVPKK